MKLSKKAFTLVELIIVIAIIGILATITIIGFSVYQKDARDSQRLSNMTVVANALEKYYDKNGEYPSQAALDGATKDGSTVATFLGIDSKALVLPTTPSGTSNAIRVTNNSATTSLVQYVGKIDTTINATDADTCLNTTPGGCDGFTLQWISESDGSVKKIDGKHNDRNALAVNPPSATTVTISDGGSTIVATASAVTCAADTTNQFQFQYRINGGAWSAWTAWNNSNTSSTGSAVASYKYEFQANDRCYNPSTKVGSASALSAVAAYTKPLNAPSQLNPGVSPYPTGTSNTATWSWSGSNCAAGSVTEYQYIPYVNGSAGSVTGLPTNATSFVLATSGEGNQYGATVSARCYNSTTNTRSGWNAYSNNDDIYTRNVTAPAAITINGPNASSGGDGWRMWNWSAPSCTSGMQAVYWWQYYDNSNGTMQVRTPSDGSASYLGTTTEFNGIVTSEGVSYGPGVLEACRNPTTGVISNQVGAKPSSAYYRPVTHNIVSAIAQRMSDNTVTPQFYIQAVNQNCASGLVNTVDPRIGYGNNGTQTGVKDFGVQSLVGGVVFSLDISYYNHTSYYAYANFTSSCVNQTTHAAADAYGRGSLNSGDYWTFGTVQTLANNGTQWRIGCATYERCDNQYNAVGTSTGATTTLVGCNNGNSSAVYPEGNGTWTSDCG